MKMEVLAVQQQYQSQYGVLGSNKVRDWTSTLMPVLSDSNNNQEVASKKQPQQQQSINSLPPYVQNNTTNKIKNSIIKKSNRQIEMVNKAGRVHSHSAATAAANSPSSNNSCSGATPLFHCDDSIDAAAANELSARLLDELRAAKSRHLTCTEVSLPCDLTPRIAAEIIRVSSKEPCGIRGCTIYIEFEDEPNNSRRIASLKLDEHTVSTFEVYLTLRQDHRGWASLLPQFMKSLARTITISPEFTITKHKLYSPHTENSSYSFGSGRVSSAAISTPTS